MKISLYPQKISCLYKIHLERNPFQFSNMAERLPFKNYSQIKSKEMDTKEVIDRGEQ